MASYAEVPVGGTFFSDITEYNRITQCLSLSLHRAISHAGVVPSGPAFFPPERLQQPKEGAVSYQEALKQQVLSQ